MRYAHVLSFTLVFCTFYRAICGSNPRFRLHDLYRHRFNPICYILYHYIITHEPRQCPLIPFHLWQSSLCSSPHFASRLTFLPSGTFFSIIMLYIHFLFPLQRLLHRMFWVSSSMSGRDPHGMRISCPATKQRHSAGPNGAGFLRANGGKHRFFSLEFTNRKLQSSYSVNAVQYSK